MNDREYYLHMISNRLDCELTPTEEEELVAAMRRDPSLVEYEQSLLRQRDTLRNLPTLTLPRRHQHSQSRRKNPVCLKRAWRAQVRIPLPLAASLALCLTGWVWLSGHDDPKSIEPTVSSTLVKYVQIERLEPL